MANELENLQEATRGLAQIKADYKTRMDALKARLDAAVHEWQKDEIQKDIDQLEKVFDRAIDRAEINRTKLEAEYLVQKNAQEARQADQRAAREEEIKTSALREWVQAGGEPAQFEAAWPSIRQAVMNERVIDALISKAKQPQTIHL